MLEVIDATLPYESMTEKCVVDVGRNDLFFILIFNSVFLFVDI